MTKKKPPTNWRKRAEEAEGREAATLRNYKAIWDEVLDLRLALTEEKSTRLFWQTQCEAAAELWKKYEKMFSQAQHQIEVGDQLLAAQRERLIRLTETKNLALVLIGELEKCSIPCTTTYELDGRGWALLDSALRAFGASRALSKQIAALEIDTALPKGASK